MPKDQKTQRYSCRRTKSQTAAHPHRFRSVSHWCRQCETWAVLDGNLRLRPTNQTCSHAIAQTFRSNIGSAQRTNTRDDHKNVEADQTDDFTIVDPSDHGDVEAVQLLVELAAKHEHAANEQKKRRTKGRSPSGACTDTG